MPSQKPRKQLDRFKAGIDKFVASFTLLVGAEEFDRKESSRNGKTTISISLKTKPAKDGGMPATRAAKIGHKMAREFHAWFSPTHFEWYDSFDVSYKRGEGFILVQGRI